MPPRGGSGALAQARHFPTAETALHKIYAGRTRFDHAGAADMGGRTAAEVADRTRAGVSLSREWERGISRARVRRSLSRDGDPGGRVLGEPGADTRRRLLESRHRGGVGKA